jgi:hypothetical protein
VSKFAHFSYFRRKSMNCGLLSGIGVPGVIRAHPCLGARRMKLRNDCGEAESGEISYSGFFRLSGGDPATSATLFDNVVLFDIACDPFNCV